MRSATSWFSGTVALLLSASVSASAESIHEILRSQARAAGYLRASETHVPTDPEVASLGRRLFESKALGLNSSIACRDCHLDQFSSADGLSNAIGVGGVGHGEERARSGGAVVPRNTLPLWGRGARGFSAFFWDGKVDARTGEIVSQFGEETPSDDPLVVAVHLPALEIREMIVEDEFVRARKREQVDQATVVLDALVDRVRSEEKELFDDLFRQLGADPSFLDIADAMASFIRDRFRLRQTRFERFVFGGGELSESELRGALMFFGKGKCATCHSGPFFSDFGFHAVPFPQIGAGKNGFGIDYGRFNVTHDPSDLYLFRTPPLANVTETAPYGHSGSLATIEEAIIVHFDPLRFVHSEEMSPLDRTELYKRWAKTDILSVGYLDDREVADVAAFLGSLSFPGTPGP